MKKIIFAIAFIIAVAACNTVDVDNINSRLESLEKASVASVQKDIEQIKETLGTLQNTQVQLSGYILDIRSSMETMDGQSDELSKTVNSLEEQNKQFDKRLKELNKAVEDSSSDIKKWVSDSYVTLELFNSLSGEVSQISSAVQSLSTMLEGLDVEGLKAATDSMTTELGKCKTEIEAIKTALKALQDDIDDIKSQISAIVGSVQSVAAVPDYDDGTVRITSKSENTLRFEVYPLDVAQKLASIGPSAFSLDYVDVQTKAGALNNIPVSAVSFEDGFLSITADGTNLPDFLKSDATATILTRLLIVDDTVTRTSDYFKITYRAVEVLSVDVTELSATIHARALDPSDYDKDITCSVELRQLHGYKWYVTDSQGDRYFSIHTSNDGVFSITIPCKSGNTFDMRLTIYKTSIILGEYDRGIFVSDWTSFETLPINATVTTSEATDIKMKSAVLSGTLTTNNDEVNSQPNNYVSPWFKYGPYSNVDELLQKGETAYAALNGDLSFSSKLSNLDSGTKYYFVAGATVNGQEFVSNDIRSFTTTGPVSCNITIDGDFSDWETVPTEYLSIATSTSGGENPAGIKTIKVLAFDDYIYILTELDPKVFKTIYNVKFDLLINSDGDSATGGGGNYFLDACADYLITFSDSWTEWYSCSWSGEPNGSGWDWNSQAIYADVIKYGAKVPQIEISLDRQQLKQYSDIAKTFSLGMIVYDENWIPLGTMPYAPSGVPPTMLEVTTY